MFQLLPFAEMNVIFYFPTPAFVSAEHIFLLPNRKEHRFGPICGTSNLKKKEPDPDET